MKSLPYNKNALNIIFFEVKNAWEMKLRRLLFFEFNQEMEWQTTVAENDVTSIKQPLTAIINIFFKEF